MYHLRSHPQPGNTLFDHLKKVGQTCGELIHSCLPYVSNQDKLRNLEQAAYVIGVTHDFAKATSFFQNMLDDRNNRTVYSRHSALSALFAYHALATILPGREDLSCYGYLAVKRHHGDLKDVWGTETEAIFNRDLIETQVKDIVEANNGFSALTELMSIYSELLPTVDVPAFLKLDFADLEKRIRRSLKNISAQQQVKNYFDIVLLYSSLQEADKRDASGIQPPPRDNTLTFDMVADYRSRKFRTASYMNELRDSVFKDVMSFVSSIDIEKNKVLSLTLPTGFGKTIAGLAIALWLRQRIEEKHGYSPRIIYCLPFLSIIDQNSQVIKQVISDGVALSNRLLIHHHLADLTYRTDDDDEAVDARSSVFLSEGWNSEFVITTFVQFFQSVVTNRKNMLRKFNKIPGSIIILDEIQAVPVKYWEILEQSLRYLAEVMGCRILFMTATKPEIVDDSLELADWRKYQFTDRVVYDFRKQNSLTAILDFVMEQQKLHNKIMVVLNTIGQSKEVYRMIADRLTRQFGAHAIDDDGMRRYGNLELAYLSSSVLPKYRLKRISRIKESKKMIVVSTQVVEAGVDIDMDVVARDFAPLDSIVQTAGRCNRNAREGYTGKVIVFQVVDENTSREYCSYVYDSVLLKITRDIVSEIGSSATEKQVLNRMRDYFANAREAKAQEPLYEDMLRLNYENVGTFELIDKYESLQVFVEDDNNAKETRLLIQDASGNIRLLPDLKGTINSNTITIRKPKEIEAAQSLPFVTGTQMKYVPKEDLKLWYDLEVGFVASLDKSIERQII